MGRAMGDQPVIGTTRVSRRDVLKGAAALGAATAAGVGLSPQPAQGAVPDPRAGWCVYDQDIVTPKHLAALQSAKPTLIRWFLSWDRFHTLTSAAASIPPDPPEKQRQLWSTAKAVPDAGGYYGFGNLWPLLLPSAANPRGTRLVVQMNIRDRRNWAGDNWPAGKPGTTWARTDLSVPFSSSWSPGREYPNVAGIGIEKSYAAFVQELDVFLANRGLDYTFGAWNEIDLMDKKWGGGYAQQNYLDPWYVSDETPWFGWSGGSKTLYDQLFASRGTKNWTSSGVVYREWMTPTIKQRVSEIDLHLYCDNAKLRIDANGKNLWRPRLTDQIVIKYPWPSTTSTSLDYLNGWDDACAKAGKPKLPFFIGETGPTGGGYVNDRQEFLKQCARLYWRHQDLKTWSASTAPADAQFYGRYLGMASHIFCGTGSSPRAVWDYFADDPLLPVFLTWWNWHPEYASVDPGGAL